MRKKTPPGPDGPLDLDRGSSGAVSTKVAQFLPEEEAADRADTRAGYRELDTMVSQSGMRRPSADKAMAVPAARLADLGHPRMARHLPPEGQVRVPLSSRQMSARAKIKRLTQDSLSGAGYRALQQLVTSQQRWREVNDALSDAVGDVQQLPEPTIRRIQRIDRAIQAFEARDPRTHVVYCNAEMPTYINDSNNEGYARNNFPIGAEVAFDRYTGATHTMHELEHDADRDNQRQIVLEMATRRGMYLGRSGGGGDNTGHLLPRGMQMWVVGTHRAHYRRPDGTTGTRVVVQLSDTPPTP